MIERVRLFYCKIFNSNPDGYHYGTKNFTEFAWATVVISLSFIAIRVGVGMYDANTFDKCRVNSISDLLLSPAYIVGCNLAKDRFDIKLN